MPPMPPTPTPPPPRPPAHLLGQRLLLLPELALNDLLVHPALEGRALRSVRRLPVLRMGRGQG